MPCFWRLVEIQCRLRYIPGRKTGQQGIYSGKGGPGMGIRAAIAKYRGVFQPSPSPKWTGSRGRSWL